MTKKRILDLDKVVAQATEIIATDGINSLSLSRLAHDLDIRTQSLYNYISNLNELISLVGAHFLDQLLEKVKDNIFGLSGNDALIKFADIVRSELLKQPELSAVIFYAHEFPNDSQMNQAAFKLVGILDRLIVSSNERIKNPSTISGPVIGAVLGFVFIEISDFYQNETPESLTEMYHQTILKIITPTTASIQGN